MMEDRPYIAYSIHEPFEPVAENPPQCVERGCPKLLVRMDDEAMLITWQHGDNPEAVFSMPRVSTHPEPWVEMQNAVYSWVDRVHEYEATP